MYRPLKSTATPVHDDHNDAIQPINQSADRSVKEPTKPATRTSWTYHVAVLLALLAKLEQELAIGIEHLHSTTAVLGDDDASRVATGRDAIRSRELAIAPAFLAELEQELVLGREDLNAMFVGIGDDDTAVTIDRDSGWEAEGVRRVEQREVRAIGCEHGHAMVVGICHDDIATMIECSRERVR